MSAPIFTRRAYRATADVIARGMEDLDESDRQYVAARLSDLFAEDNPRFDRSRFMKAAEVIEPLAGRKAAEPEGSERDRMEARGYGDGHAAATWFTPQDEESARRILRGLDEGDPEILDELPQPRLGGEFADEPTWSNILADEGCEDSDDGRPELLDAYCYAYGCAVERELVRSCRGLLGLYPEDLRR